MNTFKENIINFIKSIKIKYVVLSLILATIFTFFSQHWYINSKYWSNTYLLPEMSLCHIEFSTKNEKEQDIFQLKNIENSKNTTLELKKRIINKDTNKYIILLSISPKENVNHAKIQTKTNGTLNIKFDNFTNTGKEIKFNKIKINNKTYKQNETISIDIKQNEILDIATSSVYKNTIQTKKENTNTLAKYTIFIAYIFIFYFLIKNITKEKIINIIKKNKIPIGIFITFFIIYFITNYQLGVHSNFFNRFWTYFGDNIVFLQNVLFSQTKRFHSFIFLPFYPIFEIIFFITKNFLLSVFTIFTLLTVTSIAFLYKILEKINNSQKYENIFLTMIFGTSACIWISNFSYDVYLITNFYLSIILYLTIKEIKDKNRNYKRILFIGLLSALSFGVTTTNIITILIITSAIFITQKNKKIILTYFLSLLFFIILFQIIQIGTDSNALTNLFFNRIKEEIDLWVNWDFAKNLSNVIYTTTVMPAYVPSLGLTIIAIYLIIFLIGIKNNLLKNFGETEKTTFYTINSALIFNLIANFFWCSEAGFLFSLNHYILWFLLLKYNITFLNNTKIKNKIIYPLIGIILILQVYSFSFIKPDIENKTLNVNHIKNMEFNTNLVP